MWELSEALRQIRVMQPLTRQFNYHMALGGSVLNKGKSTKDLDLYFLPLDNGNAPNDVGLVAWLRDVFGPPKQNYVEGYADNTAYKAKLQFDYDGRRIDVFVM